MPQVKCPNGHRLQVSDKAIGQTISCPSCQASFVVEAPAAEPSPFDTSGIEEKRPSLSGVNIGGKPMMVGGFSVISLINCFLGRPLLFFGLIFVVLGRGCDATSLRSVNRTNAQYNQARESFRFEWEGKLLKAQQAVDKKTREINDLTGDGKFGDPDFQKRLNDLEKERQSLNKELSKIRQDQTSAMSDKDVADWKPLREASLKAYSNHQMSVYWYEWIFIFGTVVLVLGILTLAFTGEGAEKWIAYIMIAVLTFSIYVHGSAWLESQVASTVDRLPVRDKF